MATTHFLPDEMGRTERPGLITALGIGSFVNTVLCMLLYGIGAMGLLAIQNMPLEEFMRLAQDAIEPYAATMDADERDRIFALLELVHAKGALLMALLFLRTLVRFIGVLGMWNGRRSGFHTYAAAQLVGIFLPHLVLPFEYLGVFGPLMAIGWAAAYGTQLKRLG